MARVKAVINQKGGVGKSTVGFDEAAAEAEDGSKNVLFIDLDPQGHGTEGIGLKDFWIRMDIPTLHDALINPQKINPQDLIQEVPGEKFFAIPSNFQMMELDKDLNRERSRETRLLDLLQAFKHAFDVIVIDSPSYFGNLTDNIIRAVGIPVNAKGELLLDREGAGDLTKESHDLLRSGLIIPIQAEQTSIRAFELLLNQIQVVEAELKFKVNILTLIPNLVQSSGLANDILRDFRAILPEKMTDFNIPKKVVFQEAYKAGRSIFTYTLKDTEKMKNVLAMRECYRQLVKLTDERGEAYATEHA